MFPTPRVERVSPGHLVAVAVAPDGCEAVVWRWYDAVVLGGTDRRVRMWEFSHGEVEAQSRSARQRLSGTRAYLSAGLPGADWWVGGAVVPNAEEADVELDEVKRLYTEHDLWGGVFQSGSRSCPAAKVPGVQHGETATGTPFADKRA